MNRYHKITDFTAARLRGVGSSDIPTLAGLNIHYGQTPLTLWREKTGQTPAFQGNERTEWGHRLEGIVLAKWVENHYGADTASEYLRYKARDMSNGMFKTNTEVTMPERPYVLAHADLLVDKEDPCIIECKTTGLMSAKRDDDPDTGYSATDLSQNGIPAKVFLQVQWQLLAYDVKRAYVAVLIDGGEYREYGPITADPRVQEKCLALAERFWNCVQSKTEPKPETWADVCSLYPATQEHTAMIGGDEELKVRAMISEYHTLSASIKKETDRKDDIKNALGILIGENSVLTTAEGVKLASAWDTTSEYTSVSKIKTSHGDWYDAMKKEGIITESTRRDLRPARIKGDM